MLSDRLTKSINKMKKLDAVESAALDVEKRAKNDADYRDVVCDFYSTVKKLQQSTTDLDFTVTNETVKLLEEGSDILQSAVSAGVVDADVLYGVRQHIRKKVNPALTSEWRNYYQKKITGSLPKLNTIGHLAANPESISSIRESITGGAEWTGLSLSDNGIKSRLELFKQGIEEIEALESRLNLSDEIKDFIVNVTAGKAKISDVNDIVLAWVKSENLEDRFVIRFKN